MHDVVVIGAGLSGLTAAWRLEQAGRDVVVLEARERSGGRLAHPDDTSVDLGASWVWDTETHIHGLLDELRLESFPHHREGLDLYEDGRTLQQGRLPRSHVPERRIVGGAHRITAALAEQVRHLRTGCAVVSVRSEGGGLLVDTADAEPLVAAHVLAALPPALFARTVALEQVPDEQLQRLRHCATWMADTAKVVVRYPHRFWQQRGLSGRAVSQVGPMVEMHDLSGPGGTSPALFGFVPQSLATGDWRARLLPQLARLFGTQALSPVAVHVQAWWEEPFTLAPDSPSGSQRLLGHPSLRQPLLDGRLHLISTETSGVSPGHMDGAVERAQAVATRLVAP